MKEEKSVVEILGGHDEFLNLASELSQLAPNVPDSDDALEEFVVSTLTVFGLSEDHALLEPLQGLYRQVTNRLDLDIRHSMYRNMTDKIEKNECNASALLPFVLVDDNAGLVSTAALDYPMFRRVTTEDPLAGVRDIIDSIEQGLVANRGAVIAGLLSLGDRRVCRLLWELKDALSPEEIDTVATVRSTFCMAGTVEFFIDWLEELEGGFEDARFGAIASGLVMARRRAQMEAVFDAERNFPDGRDVEPIELKESWTIDEYAQHIAPRLRKLADEEPPPKVMPVVLAEWGLV